MASDHAQIIAEAQREARIDELDVMREQLCLNCDEAWLPSARIIATVIKSRQQQLIQEREAD